MFLLLIRIEQDGSFLLNYFVAHPTISCSENCLCWGSSEAEYIALSVEMLCIRPGNGRHQCEARFHTHIVHPGRFHTARKHTTNLSFTFFYPLYRTKVSILNGFLIKGSWSKHYGLPDVRTQDNHVSTLGILILGVIYRLTIKYSSTFSTLSSWLEVMKDRWGWLTDLSIQATGTTWDQTKILEKSPSG